MPSELLTDLVCKNAKPAVSRSGDPAPKMLCDGKGLYLRIGPGGSKSWVYRYKADGRAHDMGLGPYPEVTLAEARDLVIDQRRVKRTGVDPIAVRRATAAPKVQSLTFKELAEKWVEVREAEWSSTHRSDVTGKFRRHVYPVIGDLPVEAIDTAAVMRVISPKWLTLTESMSRVRSQIEMVLGYAVTSGYRAPGDNPARWDKHIENLLPKKSKTAPPTQHPKLDYRDMADFMAKVRASDGLTARALEFTILTAARTGEVLGAKWSEIDLEARVWVIPAARMKVGVEHRVPLSAPALALLRGLPRDGDLVFPQLVDNSMIRFLARMHVGVTVHGFRGTFSTWAAEAKFPFEVRELALAHRVGNDVERRYNTADLLDDRRRLMAAWADHCDGKPTGDNVVELKRA